MVNAFALPNGTMVISTGLLERLSYYDELVALLGHEQAHINYRHSMKNICRALSSYILVSILLNDTQGVFAAIIEGVQSI